MQTRIVEIKGRWYITTVEYGIMLSRTGYATRQEAEHWDRVTRTPQKPRWLDRVAKDLTGQVHG